MKTTRQSANVMLAIIAIIAIIGIIWIGWKIIQKVSQWPLSNPDRYTNVLYSAWAPKIAELEQMYPGQSVTLPELNLTVPLEALAWEWHYCVQTSSNLVDWTTTDLDWDQAKELIRTNHSEPCRFYRRLLYY
jgi:heme/copper-type cytochrome/quinol oxidase subunit 2